MGLAIITATSALGLVTHLAAGRAIDVPVTVAMALACMAGALAGAGWAGHLPQRALGRGFAALVLAVFAAVAFTGLFRAFATRLVLARGAVARFILDGGLASGGKIA